MKKFILFIVIIGAAASGVLSLPQNAPVLHSLFPWTSDSKGKNGEEDGFSLDPVKELKGEDGRVEISKLDESKMPDKMKDVIREALVEVDADSNGFLDEEEQKIFEEKRKERLGATKSVADGSNEEIKDEKGNFILSNVDISQAPDFIKEALRKIDVDSDGLVGSEELKTLEEVIQTNILGKLKPETSSSADGIIDRDGNIILGKLTEAGAPDIVKEALRKVDSDSNGLLDANELMTLGDSIQASISASDAPKMNVERSDPFDALKDEQGNIVLGKLDESGAPNFIKEALRKVDTDSNGLLDANELKAFENIIRTGASGINSSGIDAIVNVSSANGIDAASVSVSDVNNTNIGVPSVSGINASVSGVNNTNTGVPSANGINTNVSDFNNMNAGVSSVNGINANVSGVNNTNTGVSSANGINANVSGVNNTNAGVSNVNGINTGASGNNGYSGSPSILPPVEVSNDF